MLYCRTKLYPLGIPNALAHGMTLVAYLISVVIGRYPSFLPPRPRSLKVSVLRRSELQGQFALLMVTTLQKLLFKGQMPGADGKVGAMQLLVIDRSIRSLLGALAAAIRGRLGSTRVRGVHLDRGDEIRIEGEHSNVILDGEFFAPPHGCPIVLRPTRPVPFLRLAV
jgi:hypothetical protein